MSSLRSFTSSTPSPTILSSCSPTMVSLIQRRVYSLRHQLSSQFMFLPEHLMMNNDYYPSLNDETFNKLTSLKWTVGDLIGFIFLCIIMAIIVLGCLKIVLWCNKSVSINKKPTVNTHIKYKQSPFISGASAPNNRDLFDGAEYITKAYNRFANNGEDIRINILAP